MRTSAATTLLALALSLSSSSTLANPLSTRQIVPDSCTKCNPSPLYNQCDPTTSCTLIGSQTYCACRAGYRADGVAPGDSIAQWRLPAPYQDGRVFVAPNTTCNTLCDEWQLGKGGCQEVVLRGDCYVP